MRRLCLRSILPVATLFLATLALAAPDSQWLAVGQGSQEVRILQQGNELLVATGETSRSVAIDQLTASGTSLQEAVVLTRGWAVAGSEIRKEGRELVIVQSRDDQQVRLPSPPGRNGAIRHNPVLLTQSGELVGMLWLQGRDEASFRIEYAEWNGDRWRRRGRLTGRGPGSQLALDAVVLEDGTWLAVWSRFDRRDDEIYWSHRGSSGWSEPQRVSTDNAVPDIVPTLTSLGSEALVAWSRFDDEGYELYTARFDGAAWIDERRVANQGALYPTWHQVPGAVALVYRHAGASAWGWVEFDATGRSQRATLVAGPAEARPIPSYASGSAELLYPTGQSEPVSWSSIP